MPIQTIEIPKDQFTCDEDIEAKTLELSLAHPDKWVTVDSCFTKIAFYIHDRKPQSINAPGAEDTFRNHGGFWKNGVVIKPSPTFIKRFNFCPVSR